MTLSVGGKLYRVESSVKVTVAKGTPFIKTKLKHLTSNEVIEKNFKLDQVVNDVSLRSDGSSFSIRKAKTTSSSTSAAWTRCWSLQLLGRARSTTSRKGWSLKANFYGDTIFAIELPQFLELMVAKTEHVSPNSPLASSTKMAILETGAKIEVPLFIETGDIIKVDTKTDEYHPKSLNNGG